MTHSLAAVKSGDKWGYIDLEGQTVIPFQYDSATPFNLDGATVPSTANSAASTPPAHPSNKTAPSHAIAFYIKKTLFIV